MARPIHDTHYCICTVKSCVLANFYNLIGGGGGGAENATTKKAHNVMNDILKEVICVCKVSSARGLLYLALHNWCRLLEISLKYKYIKRQRFDLYQ